MPLTHSDVKQAIQEVRTEDFKTFLKSRRPARQAEIEGLRLARDRLAPDGQACCRWTVTLPSADMYQEMFKPAFWEGVGGKLKIGDMLDPIRDDLLTFIAKAVVVVADQARGYVEIREISKTEVASAVVDEQVIEGFEVRYEGLHKKFCVYRKQDGHLMQTQFPSRHDAMSYVKTDLRPLKS